MYSALLTLVLSTMVSILLIYNSYRPQTFEESRTLHHNMNEDTQTKSIVVKKKEKRLNIIILVFSARENFARREAIRQSWAKNKSNIYFMVGEPCDIPPEFRSDYSCRSESSVPLLKKQTFAKKEAEITHQLANEKNVVVLPMQDTYRNLPLKLRLSYEWALAHKPLWILKVDDDCFVRVEKLNRAAAKWNTSQMILRAAGWQRGYPAKSGKWKELKWKGMYPKFPAGAGHIVNYNLAVWVAQSRFELYQGEDTSLGIWLHQANFTTNFVEDTQFSTNGNCHNTTKYVVGHDIRIASMKRCADTDFSCSKLSGPIWNAFTSIIGILNAVRAPYTICFGTALHWYRDCSLGDSDIDICIDLQWMTSHLSELHKAILEKGWKKNLYFGQIGNIGYEESYLLHGVKVDLFSQHSSSKGMYTSGYTIEDTTYPCYSYIDSIVNAKWGDLTMRVIASMEKYLDKKYGNDWDKEIPHSNWQAERHFESTNGKHNCVKTPVKISRQPKRIVNTKEFSSDFLNILIPTMGRHDKVNELIASVLKFYRVKFLVADDGEDSVGSFLKSDFCDYYYVGYDKGLSFKRNFLLQRSFAKYVVVIDDDMIWTKSVNLEKAISMLEEGVDLVGFQLDTTILHPVKTSIKNGVIHRCRRKNPMNEECFSTDYVLNIFIASRSMLLKNKWDEELKLAEHSVFFLNLKKNKKKIKLCKNMIIKHNNNKLSKVASKNYISMRKRATSFLPLVQKKYGFSKVLYDYKMCKE